MFSIRLKDINDLTTGNLRTFRNTGDMIFKTNYFSIFPLMMGTFETECNSINLLFSMCTLGILTPEIYGNLNFI